MAETLTGTYFSTVAGVWLCAELGICESEEDGMIQAAHDGVRWRSSKGELVNLSLVETRCKCNKCESNSMQQGIVDLFHALRTKLNMPLTVNSGFRCAEYNKKVGGKPDSQHLYGKALDIRLPGKMTPVELQDHMESIGAKAIVLYKTFCHMDERQKKIRWDNRIIGG